MTISVLCESPRDRHPQEKCASKCIRSSVLSAFIYFLAQRISDLKFTNRVLINLRSEIPFRTFASSMKQVSGVKAKIDRDAAAPRLSFKYRFVL
jgi:hypothetical protein